MLALEINDAYQIIFLCFSVDYKTVSDWLLRLVYLNSCDTSFIALFKLFFYKLLNPIVKLVTNGFE